MSVVSANAVKAAAVSGKMIRGVHLTFPAPTIIEVLAGPAKLDFVYIDGEHGRFDWQDIEIACMAAERRGLTPIARIPDISIATITRFLDRGVRGIVAPHIETVEEARRVVSAAYFAPLGERSYGAGRPEFGRGFESLAGHYNDTNAAVCVCLMIESGKGVENSGDLAAVPGVDYLSFGMHDLTQDLGHAGNGKHPAVVEAHATAVKKIHAAGKKVREDFMNFAWINDLLVAGAKDLLKG